MGNRNPTSTPSRPPTSDTKREARGRLLGRRSPAQPALSWIHAMCSRALLVVLLSSCSTIQFRIPPACVQSREAIVFAPSAPEAERLARQFEDVAPRVRSALGITQSSPAKVALVDAAELPNAKGMNSGGWILIARNYTKIERLVIAHELVHWYLDGVWNRLPGVMAEGLADCIASGIDPVNSGVLLLARSEELPKVVLTDPVAVLSISYSGWRRHAEFDPDTTLPSIGYFIAMRIGVEGLRALCVQAEKEGRIMVPASWLLEASKLSSQDVRQWREAHLFGTP